MYALAFQKIIMEAIIDLIYFPFWWYSFGSIKIAEKCFQFFKEGNARLAPGIWLANIFVPMFAQYDWQGRIVSFFMRLVQVVFRSLALIVWLVLCLALFLLWLVIPLLTGYGFYSSIMRG